jgi:hypothetical protein
MITSADFKKHISKTLAGHLKTIGFKGSGFNYLLDSDNFIFTFGIQASQYGGQCCAEFGIQPKEIDSFGERKIDLKKLKYNNCEFRKRLSKKNDTDEWWKYSDDEQNNVQIANEIFEMVQKDILPIINLFKSEPYVLDRIEVEDLENIFQNIPKKLEGMGLMTTDIRLAWALTMIYQKRNLEKAKQYARFGLSKLDSTSTFIGKPDFEKVLSDS